MKNALKKILLILSLVTGLMLNGQIHADSASQPHRWDDLLPHPEYPIEWWYMTGFLTSEKERHFGFQATFFKMLSKIHPLNSQGESGSHWTPREIFGFHGAVSDLDRKQFVSTERERRGFSRSVIAQKDPFSVRIGRNRLDRFSSGAPSLSLVFRVGIQSFNLTLFPQTPPIWHDEHKKYYTGPNATDWAYYYSYPLVTITGTRSVVQPDGTMKTEKVHGQCWFDHEWMFHSMNKDQIGWIWVWGWNHSNTKGIMLYQMLDRGVRLSPFHRATVIRKENHTWRINRTKEIALKSGKDGQCLSLEQLSFLVDKSLVIQVHPLIKKQLLKGAVDYWEGASLIKLGKTQTLEDGKGYLEVTGLSNLIDNKFCKETTTHFKNN